MYQLNISALPHYPLILTRSCANTGIPSYTPNNPTVTEAKVSLNTSK